MKLLNRKACLPKKKRSKAKQKLRPNKAAEKTVTKKNGQSQDSNPQQWTERLVLRPLVHNYKMY